MPVSHAPVGVSVGCLWVWVSCVFVCVSVCLCVWASRRPAPGVCPRHHVAHPRAVRAHTHTHTHTPLPAPQPHSHHHPRSFIIGVACGFSSVLVPIYLGELAPPSVRGSLGTTMHLAMVSGILVSDLLAFIFATAAYVHAWASSDHSQHPHMCSCTIQRTDSYSHTHTRAPIHTHTQGLARAVRGDRDPADVPALLLALPARVGGVAAGQGPPIDGGPRCYQET
jgi:hypothetical protein